MSNNQQQQNFKKDTTNKSKIDLGFEEDDEFEEFPAEGLYLSCTFVPNIRILLPIYLFFMFFLTEWNEKDSDQEFTIWDDNWDDDDMKDDFSMQLK